MPKNKSVKFLMSLAFSLVVGILLHGGHASAATISVTANAVDEATNGNCSLYEALEAANTDSVVDNCEAGSGADTVSVPNGTYVLAVRTLDLGGTDLTVSGASRAGTVIDGDNAYGIDYDGGSGVLSLVLQHLTVTNSVGLNPGVGGGVEASVTIHDTVWSNNFTAIYDAPLRIEGVSGDENTDVSITDTEVYGNTSDDGFCGIEIRYKDQVTLSNVQVHNNLCDGSVVSVRAQVVSVNQLDAFDNTASSILSFNGEVAVTVEDVTAYGNESEDAVVGVEGPDADVSYIDVYDNTGGMGLGLGARGALGSIVLHHASVVNNEGIAGLFVANDEGGFNLDLSNITVANNNTGYPATFFMSDETNPISGTMKNMTIVGNLRAGNLGFSPPAGIGFMSNSQIAPTVTLENTLLSGNLDEGSPNNCAPPANASMFLPISIGHNLSNDTSCNDAFDQAGDINNVDARLGTLEEGNDTWVVPIQTNSPANDGGATVAGMTDDQRGTARPQNNAYDIGAYEVLGASTANPSTGANAGGNVPGVPNTGFHLLLNSPVVIMGATSLSAGAILLISRKTTRKTKR